MIIKKTIRLLLITLTLTGVLNANTLEKCKDRAIISQSPYITHSLEFFDMKECIVGASVFDTRVAETLPRTGKIFFPDKEAIKKLQPDFLFTSDWTKRSTLVDITPPKTKGFILHGFHSMAQVENNLFTIGNVLNIPNFTTKVENFKNKYKKIAKSK